jgi:Mrp family chromosome partitioning ATPase
MIFLKALLKLRQASDGRTPVALLLVETAALAGRRALLIAGDEDLESQAAKSQKTGVESEGSEDMERLTTPLTGPKGVKADRLPFAYVAGSATNMLGHEGLAALFSRISDRYDFVVVDAPSLEESDEAERLSFHVDTAILIVRWDETPRESVSKALAKLRAVGVSLPGVVFSGVDLEKYKALNA